MNFVTVRNGDIRLNVALAGEGPLILCVHGWPELAHSWRSQIEHFSAKGYTVAALDVRGYGGSFFYQLYFQQEGVAEAELERDVALSLRKIYFACSGDATLDAFLAEKPAAAGFLDGLIDPVPLPRWLGEADLRIYVEAFRAGGFRGPLNRYRAQTIDFDELAEYEGALITQPVCFIGGERDPVRHFIPGRDYYGSPGARCSDFRGATIIPKAGHWLQEAPDATNSALSAFLERL